MDIRRDARIGILHFMAFPAVMKGEGPVLETLRGILLDEFFDAVEVTYIADAMVAREAAKMLETSHVSVAFGAQPVLLGGGHNLCSLDAGVRQASVDAVRDCFEQAAILQAEDVVVLAGPVEKSGSAGDARKALAESLLDLSNAAAGYGLKIALEVFDDAVEKKSLVGKADVARQVAESVRAECPNFGLLHDLSHMPLLNETPRQALEPVADHLIHMHMGNAFLKEEDNPAYGDQHPRFGYAGGEVGVEELLDFFQALYEFGFLGAGRRPMLSLEVKPQPGEDPELVIASSKRVLAEAFRRLDAI